MNHEQAAGEHSVERYLLGHMVLEEAAAFEEHYFDCRECAGEVRLGAAFLANLKAVFDDRTRADEHARAGAAEAAPRRTGWLDWLRRPAWAPAAALLACSTAYLAVVTVPQLRRQLDTVLAPAPVAAAVLRAETRGDENVQQLPAGQPFLMLILDINSPASLPAYVVELIDGQGKRVFERGIAAPARGESLHLLVPSNRLASGSYTLSVRGDPRTGGADAAWSSIYRFRLQKQ